ncbi:unnamed protein product [Gongylonema pulchrum]|uniref:DUF3408 domain-containing protein n=1 Tax=Gongylonema pulchrum TaxID=637853 RepID=A0A183EW38_9BILA|nr:unnamed protein product [Gongylonema pulchrum]
MPKKEPVGKAIATAYPQDEKNIPDYEFPDSGHVKVNLTDADMALLEGAPSDPNLRSQSPSLISSPSLLKVLVQEKFHFR